MLSVIIASFVYICAAIYYKCGRINLDLHERQCLESIPAQHETVL